MYDPMLVQPMKDELTQLGIEELLSPHDVDQALAAESGTTLVVVNSVWGCAAGKARPGVALAMQHSVQPDRKVTVFAGQDREATARAREYFTGYPPSSPQIALLRGKDIVFMLERRDIEGRDAHDIATQLVTAFDQFCGENAPGGGPITQSAERPSVEEMSGSSGPITVDDLTASLQRLKHQEPAQAAAGASEAGGDRKWWQVWK